MPSHPKRPIRLFLCVAALAPALTALGAGEDRPGSGPVQVFILAGQSNMEGHGLSEHIKKAAADPSSEKNFSHLIDDKGEIRTRRDVWVVYGNRHGDLGAGFGVKPEKIGPELGFGWVMGEKLPQQVLLIKTCWGGHSLKEKFLPPSAGGPGPSYTAMVQAVHQTLQQLPTLFPESKGMGYELKGMAWHQAWNDMIDNEQNAQSPPFRDYTERQAFLLGDLRKEFNVPNLLMTIGECGVNGEKAHAKMANFRKAQEATALTPALRQTVQFVRTAPFWDTDPAYKSNGGYHYNGSGRTYYLKGAAFAEAMIELMAKNSSAQQRSIRSTR